MSYDAAMQLPFVDGSGQMTASVDRTEMSVNSGLLFSSQKPFPSSYSQASGIENASCLVVKNRFHLSISIAGQQTGRARS